MIQKTDSEEVTVLFDLVQEVFQKMLECVAWTFRKKPEESLQVLFFTGQVSLCYLLWALSGGWTPALKVSMPAFFGGMQIGSLELRD